ncbi:hypothetical protein JGH11_19640 [Dysgonomonas sp. Marseille-P4677]|uniref:hypothetical protein n=1 Tax=Dysgonomonas sp. Marseille-P4677 TaxID=2364790 RepID=UPI0019146A6A|nr:hypothetical protein [Dysgonomonas sp. Marseille-P4677]MBK5723084.1 hypothetical protein [Dysgonomonas sp. Marseille-P4677]
MKTIILFIITLAFILSGNLYSQNISSIKENIENNGYKTKEYICTYKSKTDAKTIFRYNPLGRIIERTFYLKENTSNWIPIQKHTYEYNTEGKISNIMLTKWNQSSKEWESKSLYLIHLYSEGQVIVHQIEKDTNTNRLITQR